MNRTQKFSDRIHFNKIILIIVHNCIFYFINNYIVQIYIAYNNMQPNRNLLVFNIITKYDSLNVQNNLKIIKFLD